MYVQPILTQFWRQPLVVISGTAWLDTCGLVSKSKTRTFPFISHTGEENITNCNCHAVNKVHISDNILWGFYLLFHCLNGSKHFLTSFLVCSFSTAWLPVMDSWTWIMRTTFASTLSRKRVLPCVCSHVESQIMTLRKTFTTHFTGIRLLSCVRSGVTI